MYEKIILTNPKAEFYRPEEFVNTSDDGTKIHWEVKIPRSSSYEENAKFNVVNFKNALFESIKANSHIILDITRLEETDLQNLYEIMKINFTKEQLLRIIIIHTTDRSKTKDSEKLVSFLGK